MFAVVVSCSAILLTCRGRGKTPNRRSRVPTTCLKSAPSRSILFTNAIAGISCFCAVRHTVSEGLRGGRRAQRSAFVVGRAPIRESASGGVHGANTQQRSSEWSEYGFCACRCHRKPRGTRKKRGRRGFCPSGGGLDEALLVPREKSQRLPSLGEQRQVHPRQGRRVLRDGTSWQTTA